MMPHNKNTIFLTLAAAVLFFVGANGVFAADGSGTNTVSPTSTVISTTGNIFHFTFTSTETMNTGGITITVPAGWSVPQGVVGIAGYTTISSTGTVGRVLDNADSISGWGHNTSGSTACSGGLVLDTTTQHEGTGAVKCINRSDKNNGLWYHNITAQNWSSYTNISFWIKVSSDINNGDLNFDYSAGANLASAIESLSLGKAITANTWTQVTFPFVLASSTRTSVASFGLHIKNLSNVRSATVWVDNFMIGGSGTSVPTFNGNTITINALTLAAGKTITITYGAGGGTSGATAPATGATSTFVTQSRTSDIGTLTNIGTSPTVTVKNPVPITTSISPTSTTAGATQFTLTVQGTNFVVSSTVNFNGVAKTTSFVSATQVTATIPASDVASAGTYPVTVTNPAPGGGTSNSQTFTVAQAASKFVILDPGTGTVGVPLTVTIQAEDSNNQLAATYSGGVTLVASGTAVTGGGLVHLINGVGTSTISTNVAQTVTLTLSDTQSTGFDVSSSRFVIFIPGAITKFTLNHPGSISTGARAAYVVGRTDQFNNPASGSSTIVYLYSSSTSTSKAFFDAATGGNQIASTTIPSGSTSTNFWYYDTIAGTYTITASDNPTAPDGAAGITDATDNVTVAAGAVKFVFANVPATATAGDTVTFNVKAVDSFGAIDTSFNQDVTVTKTGSASGGGLVDIVSGVATTTITDPTAETVTLGLQDTQSTGLGVTDSKTITFAAVPVPTPTPTSAPPSVPSGIPLGIKPGINITFSGWAYPAGSISLIRKDLGLAQAPVLQIVATKADASFSLRLNNVTRLTGQTYLLVFADKNGIVSETKAYNISGGQENFADSNIVIAPTVGFAGDSVVSKGGPIVVQGYGVPGGIVALLVDGKNVGTVAVNETSGEYRYVLDTDNLATGRHSVAAVQFYENIRSDSSSQQSFTVSPLVNPKLDLNGDGVIDIKDISIYFSYLKNLVADGTGYHTTNPNLLRVLDLNGDGKLDVQDLSILLRAIGLR